MPKANEILSSLIGGYNVVTTFIITSSQPQQIVSSNPNRWCLIIRGFGGVNVAPATINPVGSFGISCENNLILTVRDHASLVMVPWFSLAPVLTEITVIEVILI